AMPATMQWSNQQHWYRLSLACIDMKRPFQRMKSCAVFVGICLARMATIAGMAGSYRSQDSIAGTKSVGAGHARDHTKVAAPAYEDHSASMQGHIAGMARFYILRQAFAAFPCGIASQKCAIQSQPASLCWHSLCINPY